VGSSFLPSLLHARDWQHRPQLDGRGAGGRGARACARGGIGGAGKKNTAIADRFLARFLPAPCDPSRLPKSSELSAKQLFVFSFYDAPNPIVFRKRFKILAPVCGILS